MKNNAIFSGSCDDIPLRVRLVGGNPGRLTYTWSLVFTNDSSADDAVLENLKTALSTLPTDTVEYKVGTNDSTVFDKSMKFVVKVTNFLGTFKTGELTVVRKNNALPRAQLSKRSVTSKVSRVISVRGM